MEDAGFTPVDDDDLKKLFEDEDVKPPAPKRGRTEDTAPGAPDVGQPVANAELLDAVKTLNATIKNRWEDISHAGVEANFVYELRALLPREADAAGVTPGVVHGMLVTFLTRLVLDAKRDRKQHDGGRFACSMDRSDAHYFEKHCSPSSTRATRDLRAEGAVGWLPLAVAARGGDEDLGCDAARVVAEVLAEFEAAAPHGVQTTVLTDILLARASFPDAYADAYRCDRRAGRSGNKTAR